MSNNREMVEYFINEFYCSKSANLDVLVTDSFVFEMDKAPSLNFKKYVLLTMAIRNLVKLNIHEIRSADDQVFKMKYTLDVMRFMGGFGSEIYGTITVVLKNDLVDKIIVTRSRIDEELEKYIDM